MMFEKLRAQCNSVGNSAGGTKIGGLGQSTRQPATFGASLLDKLREHENQVLKPSIATQVISAEPSITPTIDVIVKNNYKMPEKQEEELLAAREEIKKKRAAKAAGILPSDSAAKLDAMARLDRYLTT
jgi:hypothetical protein